MSATRKPNSTETSPLDAGTTTALAAQPLYAQVEAIFIDRIRTGVWRPGQLIPSEFELAREIGVSQGTVRKALNALAVDNLVERRQGRGTFVAEHTPDKMLFRFFNLFEDGGGQIEPDSRNSRVSVGRANKDERERLKLDVGAEVIRISRVRTREGKPLICETITLPHHFFPGLVKEKTIPNTLYDHFQKVYGLTVSHGEERITAIAAGEREAKALEVVAGLPLVRLDRTMYALNDAPIEWRVSVCALSGAHYLVRLR